MKFICFRLVFTLVLSICIFSGCKKFDKTGQMKASGIVLTFDDDRVDNWYEYLPLLDSVNEKLLFISANTTGLHQIKKIS